MREGEGGTEREGGRDGEGRREGEGFRDVEAFAKGADGAASVSGPSPPPAQPLPPLRPALSQPVWPSCARGPDIGQWRSRRMPRLRHTPAAPRLHNKCRHHHRRPTPVMASCGGGGDFAGWKAAAEAQSVETHSTPLVSAKAAWPPLVKEVRGRGRGQDGEGGESDGSHSLTHRRHPPWGHRGGSPWANDTS